MTTNGVDVNMQPPEGTNLSRPTCKKNTPRTEKDGQRTPTPRDY